MDIQNVLVKATTLTAEQVTSILKSNSAVRPVTIGEALAKREFNSADELVAELCKEFGIEFLKDIPSNDILLDLIRDISINYAKQHGILPFKSDQDSVTVLTSNPVNLKALDDLRVMFGKRIKPIVTTHLKLQDAINRVYEKSTSNLQGLDEIHEEDVDLDDNIIDLLDAGDDDAPVIKLVNSIIPAASSSGGRRSDGSGDGRHFGRHRRLS